MNTTPWTVRATGNCTSSGMEMGTPWRLWFTLLLFYEAGSGRAEAGAMELSGILGGSVTFPLEIPAAEQFENAGWTVNSKSLVTVAAGKPPSVLLIDKKDYLGRLRILNESYSLQITHLQTNDTGQYRADVNTDKGSVTKLFTLRVYKKVPEPAIACDSVTCENETCNYNLSCAVGDGGENVTYSWTHTTGGAVVPSGSILHISLCPRDAPLNVTCTAQNPASHSSTTTSATGLCAANQPGSQSASMAGIAAPIFIGIPVLIIIALLGYMYRQRHRRVQCLPVPSLHWQWGLFHSLMSHVLLIADTDAKEGTVYLQVDDGPLSYSRTGTPKVRLKTKEDETKTIYAMVQTLNQSPPQTDDEKLGKDGLESTEKGEKTIYATVNRPTEARGTKSTDADDSVATPVTQKTTEYQKII
ncbi:SLAM family member 5-like [Pangshura tecta]